MSKQEKRQTSCLCRSPCFFFRETASERQHRIVRMRAAGVMAGLALLLQKLAPLSMSRHFVKLVLGAEVWYMRPAARAHSGFGWTSRALQRHGAARSRLFGKVPAQRNCQLRYEAVLLHLQVTGKDLMAQDEELYNNLENLLKTPLTGDEGFTFSITVWQTPCIAV
jgi:hypothetical protein